MKTTQNSLFGNFLYVYNYFKTKLKGRKDFFSCENQLRKSVLGISKYTMG